MQVRMTLLTIHVGFNEINVRTMGLATSSAVSRYCHFARRDAGAHVGVVRVIA
jgi:hypothetical protein